MRRTTRWPLVGRIEELDLAQRWLTVAVSCNRADADFEDVAADALSAWRSTG